MLFLVLQFLIVAIFAALLCRWKIKRGVRPTVWIAVVSAFAAAFIFWIGLELLFGDGHFFEMDVQTGYWMPGIMFGLNWMISLPIAAVVVAVFQRKSVRDSMSKIDRSGG